MPPEDDYDEINRSLSEGAAAPKAPGAPAAGPGTAVVDDYDEINKSLKGQEPAAVPVAKGPPTPFSVMDAAAEELIPGFRESMKKTGLDYGPANRLSEAMEAVTGTWFHPKKFESRKPEEIRRFVDNVSIIAANKMLETFSKIEKDAPREAPGAKYQTAEGKFLGSIGLMSPDTLGRERADPDQIGDPAKAREALIALRALKNKKPGMFESVIKEITGGLSSALQPLNRDATPLEQEQQQARAEQTGPVPRALAELAGFLAGPGRIGSAAGRQAARFAPNAAKAAVAESGARLGMAGAGSAMAAIREEGSATDKIKAGLVAFGLARLAPAMSDKIQGRFAGMAPEKWAASGKQAVERAGVFFSEGVADALIGAGIRGGDFSNAMYDFLFGGVVGTAMQRGRFSKEAIDQFVKRQKAKAKKPAELPGLGPNEAPANIKTGPETPKQLTDEANRVNDSEQLDPKTKTGEVEFPEPQKPAGEKPPETVKPSEPEPPYDGPPIETSIKKAQANEERERDRNLGEMAGPITRKWGTVADEAWKEYKKDNDRGRDLAEKLSQNPRPIKDTEAALLDIHRVNLHKKRNTADAEGVQAAKDLVEAKKTNDLAKIGEAEERLADAKRRAGEANKDFLTLEQASSLSLRESARGLAFARAMMKEDYSLIALETRRLAENDYKWPDDPKKAAAMKAEVKKLHDDLHEALTERDMHAARVAELESLKGVDGAVKAASSRTSPPPITSKKFGANNKLFTREAMEKDLAELRASLQGGFNIKSALRVAGFYTEGGVRDFTEFSAAMVHAAGDKIKPHLKTLWDQSQATYQKFRQDAAKTKLSEGIAQGRGFADMQRQIGALAESHLASGVKGREALIDALHKSLKGVDPSVTRRETMEAFTAYGKWQELSKDPIKRERREIQAETLKLLQLEDLQSGKPAKKTGREQPAPTEEGRRLTKEVNEAKKKVAHVDPAKELKSSLDARKTQLRNEITALDRQIKDGPDPKTKRTKLEYDEEAKALVARRDALKKQFNETYEKPGLTDEQRLAAAVKAADRSFDEIDKRIKKYEKTGNPADLFPGRKKSDAPTNDELDAARSRRDARREDLDALQKIAKPKKTERQKYLDATEKRLLKQMDSLKEQMAAGKKSAKTAGQRHEDNARIKSLKDQMKETRAQYAAVFGKPGQSPEQRLAAYKKRLMNRDAELDDRIARAERGDFSDKKKKPEPVVLDQEAIALDANVKIKQRRISDMLIRDRMAKRSLTEKAVTAAFVQVPNLSRAVLSSFDLSAVLRQGGFVTLAHPKRALKAFPSMLKSAGNPVEAVKAGAQTLRDKKNPFKAIATTFKTFAESGERGFERSRAELQARPNYDLARRSGLFLAERGSADISKLSHAEEAYMSGLSEKIPGVAASERAYLAFLNRIRMDSFDAMAASLSRTGNPTPAESKAIANFVNVATGRGSFKDSNAMAGVSSVLWSPRLLASRIQMLGLTVAAPVSAFSKNRVRKMVAGEIARSLRGLGVMYTLAGLAGFEVELDPRSSDFGKLRKGDTSLDPLGGEAQLITLGARLVSGERKSLGSGLITSVRGEDVPYGQDDAAGVIGNALRSKLAPAWGALINSFAEKDMVGNPTDWQQEILDAFDPLIREDIVKSMKKHGATEGGAMSLLAFFGMGMQNFPRNRSKKKKGASRRLPR